MPLPLALRTLVVAEHPATRGALLHLLQRLGWPAQTAEGAAAQGLLEQARRAGQPFDLVLADRQMSDPDRAEFLSHLPLPGGVQTHVLLLVGGQERELLMAARQDAGEPALLDRCLVKPLTAGLLQDAWARRQGAERVPQPAAAAAGASLTGVHLLLVEDNPHNQQVALELLEAEGAVVSVADHGGLALDCLRAQGRAVDLVLMDMQMPVMDGLTTTRAIRNELGLRELPIVAMTANALPADRELCLQAGMNEHVGKPFEMEPLVALILRLVKGADAPRQPPQARLRPSFQVDPQRQQLALADGIDLQAALDRFMGKLGLYQRMGRSFVKSAQALPQQLREHARDLSGAERHEADVHALHSFKGLAATLAVTTLARWGEEGEHQAKAGQTLASTWVDALQAEIERGCDALLGHLQALGADEPDANAARPAARPDGALAALLAAVQAQDMQALTLLADQRATLERELGERLAELDDALANLDFSRAAELLAARATPAPAQP